MQKLLSGLSGGRIPVAVLMTVVLMLSVTGSVSAQGTQGATLTVVSGETAVVRSNGSASQPAANGSTLGTGDRVATLGSSTALVTFFEGSEIELGANTTIILREIQSSGNQVNVTVEDVVGSTFSRIQTFANPNSTFKVQNPGGTAVAVVRGSEVFFSVLDVGGGRIRINCTNPLRPCEIIIGGKVVWQGVGISPEFAYTPDLGVQESGSPERQEGTIDPGCEGRCGEEDDDDDGADEEEEEDSTYTNDGRPAPPSAQLLQRRLAAGLDPINATGSLLVLGMIGWTFYGSGPRRRS